MKPVGAWAGVYAKGLAMGLADLVPGVSGGTIAFISGIYDELVATLAGLDGRLLGAFRERGVRGVWQAGNLGFLAVLLSGIGTSVFAFAGLLHWLLANRPAELWAFFFGLVAASICSPASMPRSRSVSIRRNSCEVRTQSIIAAPAAPVSSRRVRRKRRPAAVRRPS